MHLSKPRISIEQVRAFTVLAARGSLRAAARQLCLSEEGLRGRILALEACLGASLYEKERGRRGEVRLTPNGRSFLEKATRFMAEAQALTVQADSADASPAIRIVASDTAACCLTPHLLHDFHAAFRGHGIRVSTRADEQVVRSLRQDDRVTAAIAALDQPPEGLDHHHWGSVEWSLVVPAEHPFAGRTDVTLAELASEPLITLEEGSAGRSHVLEAFYVRDLAPRIAVEVSVARAAIGLAAAGLGLALVPAPLDGDFPADGWVTRAALRDPIRTLEIVLLTRTTSRNDPTTRAVVEFLLRHQPSGTSVQPRASAQGMTGPARRWEVPSAL